MFLLYVRIKPVRDCIKVIFSYTTNEALGLEIFLHAVQLITQLSKGVDNQTC